MLRSRITLIGGLAPLTTLLVVTCGVFNSLLTTGLGLLALLAISIVGYVLIHQARGVLWALGDLMVFGIPVLMGLFVGLKVLL